MTHQEAAALLGWRSEEVLAAIKTGAALPVSTTKVRLHAEGGNGHYDIDEADLDDFVSQFEQEQPGRHPPTAVRRQLRTEARHRCAVCGESAPLQYHHILEFSKLKHHDPQHMLAVCATCHTRIHSGFIDEKDQRYYKDHCWGSMSHPGSACQLIPSGGPLRFGWDDLRSVVVGLHEALSTGIGDQAAQYDLSSTDLDDKNRLNEVSAEYFDYMKTHQEPYFAQIQAFLSSPSNTRVSVLYFEVVDELRRKLALRKAEYGGFANMLDQFQQAAIDNAPAAFRGRRALLSALISFMYFNCDIGKKP
jgi:hypothetical protein